jgi:hypothetical protein
MNRAEANISNDAMDIDNEELTRMEHKEEE